MTRRLAVAGLLLLALAAGAAAYRWGGDEASQPRADPADARMVALGERVYLGHCASCHGVELEGQPDWRVRKPDGRLPAPPHDETGHTWHHSDDVLFRVTKHGLEAIVPGYETDMPAYDGVLTDEEIWAVLAYIKNHWPEHILAIQADIDERAREAARR